MYFLSTSSAKYSHQSSSSSQASSSVLLYFTAQSSLSLSIGSVAVVESSSSSGCSVMVLLVHPRTSESSLEVVSSSVLAMWDKTAGVVDVNCKVPSMLEMMSRKEPYISKWVDGIKVPRSQKTGMVFRPGIFQF